MVMRFILAQVWASAVLSFTFYRYGAGGSLIIPGFLYKLGISGHVDQFVSLLSLGLPLFSCWSVKGAMLKSDARFRHFVIALALYGSFFVVGKLIPGLRSQPLLKELIAVSIGSVVFLSYISMKCANAPGRAGIMRDTIIMNVVYFCVLYLVLAPWINAGALGLVFEEKLLLFGASSAVFYYGVVMNTVLYVMMLKPAKTREANHS